MPILRKRMFPTYCAPRNLLNRPSNYTPEFKKVVSKVWSSKNRAFTDRFVRSKKRLKLNLVIRKAMFRGTKLFLGFKKKINSGCQPNVKSRSYIKNKFSNYLTKKNHWMRWRQSKKRFSSRWLSKLLSKRTGMRVQAKAINVFTYLLKKTKKVTFNKSQKHIWNKRYHYNKRRFLTYYDMVNSLWLLCHVPNSEILVMRMIRYGLTKMHRRKIRPKNFFYFINAIVQNMPEIKQNFNAFRVMITGKLRGGTSRTKSFSTGFGMIPRQTLDKNIRYEFGNVRSKYGSFGVKLLTWRKSDHEMVTDRHVKWSMYHQKQLLNQRINEHLQPAKKNLTKKKRKNAKHDFMIKRRSLLYVSIAKRKQINQAFSTKILVNNSQNISDNLLLLRFRLNTLLSSKIVLLGPSFNLNRITSNVSNLESVVNSTKIVDKKILSNLNRVVYMSLKPKVIF